MLRNNAGWVWVALGILLGGCGESDSGIQTTNKTVRQVKPEAAEGMGGYRTVRMPDRAKRHNVVADPKAAPTFAYHESLRPR